MSSANAVSHPRPVEAPARRSAKGRLVAAFGDTTVALHRLLRAAQPVSHADIARRLGVQRSTITEVVKPLLDRGMLRVASVLDANADAPRMGRPATGMEFTDDR